MSERKKVNIESKLLENQIKIKYKFNYDYYHTDKDMYQAIVDNCLVTLEALLNIHTNTSNCCPEITGRLQKAIQYVMDIEVK